MLLRQRSYAQLLAAALSLGACSPQQGSSENPAADLWPGRAPDSSPGTIEAARTDVSALVTWEIGTVPLNAVVLDASSGQVLGHTPWRISRPSGRGGQKVRLHKNGYEPVEVLLDKDRSEKRHLLLRLRIVL